MKGQVIGKTMPHGYAGSYSRQADMIVDTHPCEAGIAFGAPVVLKASRSPAITLPVEFTFPVPFA